MIKLKHNVFLLIFLSIIYYSFVVHAVSYSPFDVDMNKKVKSIFPVGSWVYLFQSGTPDVKRDIKNYDILIVFRENEKGEMKKVGRIEVISFMREIYIKGKVIEGKIKKNDIAKKGNVSCIVVLQKKFF